MREWLLLGLSLGTLTSCAPEVGGAAASEGRSLELMPASVDLGAIVAGELIEVSFQAVSTVEGGLAIERVISDCGCSVASFARGDGSVYVLGSPLLPGEVLEGAVSIETADRAGRLAVDVVVEHSNGRELLAVVGDVLPRMIVTPRSLDFGCVMQGSDVIDLDFVVSSPVAELIRLEAEEAGLPEGVGVELGPAGGDSGELDGTGWTVRVRLDPSGGPRNLFFRVPLKGSLRPAGVRGGSLELRPSTACRVNIIITGRISGPVYVEPTHLSFGEVGRGESGRAELRVVSHLGALDSSPLDFSFSNDEGEWPGGFSVDVLSRDAEGVLCALIWEVPSQARGGAYRGSVTVRSRLDGESVQIEVPIVGAIAGLVGAGAQD